MTPQCLLSCCFASLLAAGAGRALYQHPQLLGGKLWFVEKPKTHLLCFSITSRFNRAAASRLLAKVSIQVQTSSVIFASAP